MCAINIRFNCTIGSICQGRQENTSAHSPNLPSRVCLVIQDHIDYAHLRLVVSQAWNIKLATTRRAPYRLTTSQTIRAQSSRLLRLWCSYNVHCNIDPSYPSFSAYHTVSVAELCMATLRCAQSGGLRQRSKPLALIGSN